MTTGIAGSSARQLNQQQTHYLRFSVGYSDPGIAAGAGKQWLPKGALILRTSIHVGTAFNAGTTNVLTVGINNPSYDNIVAAADVAETATGLTQNVKPTGTALGPLASDAQVFALFAQTGTSASAGQATVVIEYVPNNDL
jgi:hypothetical protein